MRIRHTGAISPRRRRAVRQPGVLDEVGAFLADHVRRSDGVRARDGRHYGTVDHPQPVHAVHPELGVHHGVPVPFRAHLARAALVVHLHGHRLHAARPVRVRAELQVAAPHQRVPRQRGPEPLERLGLAQLDDHLDGFHDAVQVHGVGEEVRVDHRLVERVGAAQSDLWTCKDRFITEIVYRAVVPLRGSLR